MNAPKYRPPLDPAVAIWAENLDADAREYFEERAAIREFDGLQPRGQAEAEAKKETEVFLARRNQGSAERPQLRTKPQK